MYSSGNLPQPAMPGACLVPTPPCCESLSGAALGLWNPPGLALRADYCKIATEMLPSHLRGNTPSWCCILGDSHFIWETRLAVETNVCQLYSSLTQAQNDGLLEPLCCSSPLVSLGNDGLCGPSHQGSLGVGRPSDVL